MKKALVLTLLVASFLSLNFSSCDRFPSQGQSEVRKAFLAIQNQDLSSFRALLQGEALEEFGTADGMARLQKVVRGLSLTVGASVTSVETKYSDHNWPAFCVYQVPVELASSQRTVLTTKISCRIGYSRPNPERESGKVNPTEDCSREFILDQRNNINREVCHIEGIEIL